MLCGNASIATSFITSPNVTRSGCMYSLRNTPEQSPQNHAFHSRIYYINLITAQKCPFPSLFLYYPGMPAMILANICTSMGQVNGARGTATGIVVDPTGIYFFYISNVYH
jgi:hypothetical protein